MADGKPDEKAGHNDSDRGQTLRLAIDSELANTTLVAMAVRGLCAITTMSPLEINRLELCLVEIVNNAIEHAYSSEKGHSVEVVVELLKTTLTVTVSDWGKSMPLEILSKEEQPIDPDNPEAWICSGRGLHIVQNLMDHIEYHQVQGKNSFVMTKQLRH